MGLLILLAFIALAIWAYCRYYGASRQKDCGAGMPTPVRSATSSKEASEIPDVGDKVRHADYGQGVVVGFENGTMRVKFGCGTRHFNLDTLTIKTESANLSSRSARENWDDAMRPLLDQKPATVTGGERDGARWVAPGQSVTVSGLAIPGGMLYVGRHLPSIAAGMGPDPALINPDLSVDLSRPNRSGEGMPYWPSYSSISSSSRAAYLQWLAGGRRDPNAYIGYVFLFFYGLERRLLYDAINSEVVRSEAPLIAAEVERLLRLYGSNGSFHGYASGFLDLVDLCWLKRHAVEAPPPLEGNSYQLPWRLQLGLGRLVAAGRPIPADWAFAWLCCNPQAHLRTPATRCQEEFRALFRQHYEQQFSGGMILKPNKSRLHVSYRPASASFGEVIDFPLDLPDVAALSAPLEKLQKLAEQCCDELDSYSRWLGRHPDKQGTVESLALLPPSVATQIKSGPVKALDEWLASQLLVKEAALVNAGNLLLHWPGTPQGKMPKAEARSLAQALERLGYGLEPDVRFGGPAPSVPGKLVVFRQGPGAPESPSKPYTAAAILLRLATAISGADGEVSEAEERHLLEHIESALHLSAPERARLRAHLRWLLETSPGLIGLKKHLALLSAAQRGTIAQFLVSVAGADGRIDPGEVKLLAKVYRLLGLDPEDVYRDIHALGSGAPAASEPVTVRPAEPAARGYAIPPERPREGGFSLNMALVQKRIAETAAVSALLGDIFAEDEPVPATPFPPGEDCVCGLDGRHSTLLRALAARGSWTRSEFEALANGLGLMPDGALEAINDAAMEACEEPVCEGEETIKVNLLIVKELLS